MDQKDIDLIINSSPRRRWLFPYFRDRYALQLLADHVGDEGRSIAALRRGRFASLLHKPLVKACLASCGDGVLSRLALESNWPRDYTTFHLSLGRWVASSRRSEWIWSQVSRPGGNVVLHLNFNRGHDASYGRLDRRPAPHGVFTWRFHPHDGRDRFTCAWSRIDVDLDAGEALIEEIQNDWIREALRCARELADDTKPNLRARTWFDDDAFRYADFERYIAQVVRPLARIWDEAMLAATIRFLREDLGVSRIYYHSQKSGRRLKHIHGDGPPRSLYTTLPRKFCFADTDVPPRMLVTSRVRQVRESLRRGSLRWFVLDET